MIDRLPYRTLNNLKQLCKFVVMTDRISERMELNLQKGLEKIESVIASHDKRLSSLEKKITDLECSASFANNLIEEQKKII